MLDFIRKFFLEGFVYGNYDYGLVHILGILVTLAAAILLPIYFKNKDEKVFWRFARTLAALTLIVYFSRRILDFSLSGNFTSKNFFRTFWLFYLCNVNTVVMSLMILFKAKKGYEYVMITGFIGGVITFLIPDGIFTDQFLTFPIFDSMFSHFILVVMPPIFIVKKLWRPSFERVNQVIFGMLLVVFNVEVIQRIFFGKDYVDYLFFHGDIPFVIPGHPELQFLVIAVSFLLVLGLIYFINYLASYKPISKKIKNFA